jgi:hypothetical protein
MTLNGINYVKNHIPNYFNLLIEKIISNLEQIKEFERKKEKEYKKPIRTNHAPIAKIENFYQLILEHSDDYCIHIFNSLMQRQVIDFVNAIYSNNKNFYNFPINLVNQMNNNFNDIIKYLDFYDEVKTIQQKLHLDNFLQPKKFNNTDNKNIIKI